MFPKPNNYNLCYSNTGSQKYTFHLNISELSEVWIMRGNELLLVHDVSIELRNLFCSCKSIILPLDQGGKSTYGSIRHPTYWGKEKRAKSTESLQEAVNNNKDTGRIRRMVSEQNWGSSKLPPFVFCWLIRFPGTVTASISKAHNINTR